MAPRCFPARPLAATVLALSCAAAHADIFGWNWSPDPSSPAVLGTGGTIRSLSATFDAASGRLAFSVEFSDRRTEGFSLVLTDGPSPLGRHARYGIFFFDAYDVFDDDITTDIKLTSYAYNGGHRHDSWLDRDASAPGLQPPDPIKPAADQSWILDLAATDTVFADGTPGRLMSFEVDASDIIAHTPISAGDGPWFGTGFADLLGIRFAPAEVFETDYTPDGRIDWLGTENEGNFSGEFQTLRIPAPGGALALSTAALFTALARRRRGP